MKLTHYYLAICHVCEPILPMPFTDEAQRTRWLEEHQTATGHMVTASEEVRMVRI